MAGTFVKNMGNLGFIEDEDKDKTVEDKKEADLRVHPQEDDLEFFVNVNIQSSRFLRQIKLQKAEILFFVDKKRAVDHCPFLYVKKSYSSSSSPFSTG